METTKRTWLRIALLNLVIAATLGALLRFAFVEEVSWLNFHFMMHAHSHVAMLGWVYLALYTFLIDAFLPAAEQERPVYRWLFWLTEASVLGMLFTFPFQGYAPASTGFAGLHIVLSYVFSYHFLKGIKARPDAVAAPSGWFARAAIFFMVLSTFAIWALPVIVMNGAHGSALYYGTIQFFLHFQFNGWYLFGLMALVLRTLERRQVALSLPRLRWFFWTLVISCFLTYALVIAWSTPHPVIFWVNSLGVLVQLGAAVLLVLLLWPVRRGLGFPVWERRLYAFAFISLIAKIAMQALIAVPAIATVGFTLRNYVIGFIHLVLLGVVTSFLTGYGQQQRLFHSRSRLARLALWLFLTGFVLSESVLFVQGTLLWARFGFLPGYYVILFGVSVLLPLGLALFLFAQLKPDSVRLNQPARGQVAEHYSQDNPGV